MKNFYFLFLLFLASSLNAQNITVTSLADDDSTGTLRWAMNEANSDSNSSIIDFDSSLSGTITLTSNLPKIIADLTILGSGKSKITISGDNQYRMFNVGAGFKFNLKSVTLTKAGYSDQSGASMVFVSGSTAELDDVLVTGNENWRPFNSRGSNSFLTILNSELSNNSSMLFHSDHGNTPANTSSESTYDNRLIIKKTKFLNNTSQIFWTERYVRIDSCEFIGNESGIGQFNGVNRFQILNSTFKNNKYELFYYSSWLTYYEDNSWIQSLSENNFLFDNNIFENNPGTIINSYSENNQLKTTITNNTFVNNGLNWYGTPKVVHSNYLDNFITYVDYKAENNTVLVTMSKPVFSNVNSAGKLDVNDFQFVLTGGSGTLNSTTPSSISIKDSVITLGIQLNGSLSGSEVLKVVPVLNSIYDAQNNIASEFQKNNTINLIPIAGEKCSNAIDLNQNKGTLSVNMSDFKTRDFLGSTYINEFGRNDAFFYQDVPKGAKVIFSFKNTSNNINNQQSQVITATLRLGNQCVESNSNNNNIIEYNIFGLYGDEGYDFNYINTSDSTQRIELITSGHYYAGYYPDPVFNLSTVVCQSPTIDSFSPESGEVGSQIVITGTNLETVSAVMIGGIEVESFAIDSPTQITATVGLGATGKISIINCVSQVQSTSDFTVNYKTPIISSFTPAQTGQAGIVEILGSHFAGTTEVSFGSTAATNFSVESDSLILATVGIGTSGSISVSNPAGTANASGFKFLTPATKVSIAGKIAIDDVPNFTTSIVDSTIVVSGDGMINGAKVQITGGYVSGDSGDFLDYSGTLPRGFNLNYDYARGLLIINGQGSPSVWQSILRKITIKSTNATCYPEQRLVTFNLGDKYYNPLTGHWYEYIPDPMLWTAARDNAATRTYFGKLGYLSTVTSAAENNFIWKIMTSDAWLGGTDKFEDVNLALGRTVYPDKASIEGKYFWVTGPESGTQFSEGNLSPQTLPGQYANWAGGEPNDFYGEESRLQFYSGNSGLWNDLFDYSSLGFLIEYGGLNGDDNSSVINFTRELRVEGSTSGTISGGGVNVCPNTNSTELTLSGNSGNVVRWEYSYDNFYTDGIVIDNTTTKLLVKDITRTTYFRAITVCEVTEINTASVTISVNETMAGSISAENNTICEGGNVKLSLSGKQGDVIKWQVSTDQNIWTDIANTTIQLTDVVAKEGTYYYRAVVQTAGCGPQVNSVAYPITVNSGQPPVGGSVSGVVYSSPGDKTGTLTLTGHTGTISKWQSSINNGLIWNDISNDTETLQYSGVSKNTLYRAVLTNGSCGLAYSSVGSIIFQYPPTDLSLKSANILEDSAIGSVGLTLSSTDFDNFDTHNYTLVAGEGDQDNSSFEIVGNQLKSKIGFDFESKDAYKVRIRSTDGLNLSYEKSFIISIANVNETPTAIALSANTINENSAIGTVLAQLSSTDVDAGDTHTYTLVSGTGDTNNSSFEIVGNELKVKESFDFEKKSSYSVRIQTTDAGSLSFEDTFTISVKDVKETPIGITLSANTINENSAIGTVLAQLSSTDVDAGDTHTYTLVSGTGDINNSSFEIVGNELKIKEVFDFEKKSSYSVRIKTSDAGALSYENTFTITIKDVNEAPTSIALSATSINENSAVGTVLASLSSTDADVNDTHSYTLASGSGDTDNSSFEIVGNELKIKEVFDFEKKSSYSIRIKTIDAGLLSFEDTFTITIKDVNEAPTAIALSATSINENSAVGTVLASLSSTDQDAGDSHTYTLVAGMGDTNNSSFEIDGSNLKIKESFDFEKKSSYTIRIKTTDAGSLSYENNFTITIKDLNETPTKITASKLNIYEGNNVDDLIGLLTTTDEDAGDAHTYSLVSGTGSSDNAAFKIVNGQLRAAQSFVYNTKNNYAIRIRTTDKGGLTYEQAFTVSISQKPVLTGTGNETFPNTRTAASATPSISLGYSSNLYVSGADIVSYNWSLATGLNSTSISNPIATPKVTTTYTVEVTNRFGSKTSVSITVTVREDFNITPSNLLTPNGDGENDIWTIENLISYPTNKVLIFNRQGQIVYSKTGYTNDWNGQYNGAGLPEGTYYYVITLNNGAGEKKGFISIINN